MPYRYFLLRQSQDSCDLGLFCRQGHVCLLLDYLQAGIDLTTIVPLQILAWHLTCIVDSQLFVQMNCIQLTTLWNQEHTSSLQVEVGTLFFYHSHKNSQYLLVLVDARHLPNVLHSLPNVTVIKNLIIIFPITNEAPEM